MALARPGVVQLFGGAGPPQAVAVPGTAHASQFLPVQGVTGGFWFLARLPSGWAVFGVSAAGRPSGPRPLDAFGPGAEPAVPAYSAGLLYTLDQDQPGQPSLWAIQPATGVMKTVPGAPAYPAESVTEKAGFQGAQVLVDGPRVIFNNPESLLAVVVFTDGSHAPVVVNKSDAVEVSAAGPGDVNVKREKPKPQPKTPTAGRGADHDAYDPGPAHGGPAGDTAGRLRLDHREAVRAADQFGLPLGRVGPGRLELPPPGRTGLPAQHVVGDRYGARRGAPSRPAHVQLVDGQEQLLFTGLQPGTAYQAVVTAYIGRESTSSAPVSFTTTAVGPGPPASVQRRRQRPGRLGRLLDGLPRPQVRGPGGVLDRYRLVVRHRFYRPGAQARGAGLADERHRQRGRRPRPAR